MHKILTSNLPTLIFLFSFAVITCLLKYWDWSTKRSNKKSPLTQDLLRAPGESLVLKINDMTIDILMYMTFILIFPMMLCMFLLSQYAFSHKLPSNFTFILFGIIFIGGMSYLVFKLYQQLKLRRMHRLGLEAEMAVGQELNLLMRQGYWVFHDFPADNFNIDHIVIGTNRVFAVETKGRPKRHDKNGKVEAKVAFDGARLVFPGWSERKPVEQAKRQAKWLQDWLTKALGQHISVQSVLALPGWYIERSTQSDLSVINGKNCGLVFDKLGRESLSEELVNQIKYQIDLKCRTVTTRSYKSSS